MNNISLIIYNMLKTWYIISICVYLYNIYLIKCKSAWSAPGLVNQGVAVVTHSFWHRESNKDNIQYIDSETYIQGGHILKWWALKNLNELVWAQHTWLSLSCNNSDNFFPRKGAWCQKSRHSKTVIFFSAKNYIVWYVTTPT